MLLVIGEALVDVLSGGLSAPEAYVGGSPMNVAVGLARLGHSVGFVGQYGKDEYGDMIHRHLRDNSVVELAPRTEQPTSTAKGQLDPAGSATYTFDISWDLKPLDGAAATALEEAQVLHVGSIGSFLDPGAASVIDAVERARGHATISFDPNVRSALIQDKDAAISKIEHIVSMSDIVRASDSDLEWLYPERDARETAQAWLELGASLVCVTYGSGGPWAVVAGGEARANAVAVEVEDTVGAGDSFMSALISALVERELVTAAQRDKLRGIAPSTVHEVIDFAARAAAITVSRAGANPPYRAEIS
ncbi:carbohydrate kinase family protein [Neomicrococcus lactis]|uniref:Fructokinase n=1 Tax=Neomicrococcus lactis TaxID=732241 RepID=A0A7W8YC52_9MICC|nr:carbohydrate kinase [Neomicrococcus lactis]MBB5598814.1 fructokinase [Neomicrococcus lactis]